MASSTVVEVFRQYGSGVMQSSTSRGSVLAGVLTKTRCTEKASARVKDRRNVSNSRAFMFVVVVVALCNFGESERFGELASDKEQKLGVKQGACALEEEQEVWS